MSKDSVPGQVTFPGEASSGFITDKPGVIYPREIARTAAEFIDGEGAMGFERNQGVKRDGFKATEAQGGTMGQTHNSKLKSGGSHNI